MPNQGVQRRALGPSSILAAPPHPLSATKDAGDAREARTEARTRAPTGALQPPPHVQAVQAGLASPPPLAFSSFEGPTRQKSLLFYWDPAHHDEVREALAKAGRRDLIGSGPGALVPPKTGKGSLPIHMRRRTRVR